MEDRPEREDDFQEGESNGDEIAIDSKALQIVKDEVYSTQIEYDLCRPVKAPFPK